jgi:hypothetical protein
MPNTAKEKTCLELAQIVFHEIVRPQLQEAAAAMRLSARLLERGPNVWQAAIQMPIGKPGCAYVLVQVENDGASVVVSFTASTTTGRLLPEPGARSRRYTIKSRPETMVKQIGGEIKSAVNRAIAMW